ncbi:MAG: 1-deoxy-D-xylulose-5-phosphate reductoisomerase, partial [Deltaproteobacteria bacterium]|nr:1-deoxy-D-xylulose-5-phosphate reductoisomerase [Deltaproteobacteria bacterium]
DMGAKITIDSATLMNKGLELIEARWLFGLGVDKLAVHVHPTSMVHSLVEFQDGSVMAQLGMPDMRVPIAYAMTYPDRLVLPWPRLDLTKVGPLEFFEPDLEAFPCLALALEVLKKGKTYPAVLNAANEIAVAAFLEEKIGFIEIPSLVEKTLEAHTAKDFTSLEEILEVDAWAREKTKQNLSSGR